MAPASSALLAVLAFLVGARPSAGSDPVSKVVELLDSLVVKVTKEGEAEDKAYKEFVEWCDGAAKNTEHDLKTAQAKKEKLEALIGKAAGDAEAAASKIEELASGISSTEAEVKAAEEIRKKEIKDFSTSEAELMESIDATSRAIAVIQREMQKNPAAFAQVDTSSTQSFVSTISAIIDAASLQSADKQRLMSLVQSKQGGAGDDDFGGAPTAAPYTSHSSDIVDVLEDLKEKAEEELSGLRRAETNAKHNYEMLKQSLKDQIAADKKGLEEAKATKAASLETKAQAEGDLSVTVKDIADAEKRLQTSRADCIQVAADHEATVAGRKEELAVLAKAKEILTSTTSGATERSYSFLQRGTALARSRLSTRADLANIEVVAMVKRLAQDHHSAALAQLASRISAVLRFGGAAGEEPFAKVKSMIADLISKLQAQASSEATEKAYCDEQLAKGEQKKGELQFDLDKMSAKLDQAAANSAELKAEVQQLQAELAALSKEQAEMTQIRREEHEAYTEAKADLEMGLEGIRKALGVLREYYGTGTAVAAPSLVQEEEGQPALPEKHAKAGGAGSSILGMMEVIESDFAKSLASEETQEEDAQTQYDAITQQNEVSRTLKEQDVKYKTQEFTSLDKVVADLSNERETTDAELQAVLEYDAKIKERCIARPETFEERKSRREAEIQGLKQALSILEDETAFVQDRKRSGRKHHFLSAEH